MQIQLFVNSSPKNKLNKEITLAKDIDGVLRDQASVLNPIILVKDVDTEFNYCYIPEFKRYYFLEGITRVLNGARILQLKCDVLMSFKDEILETKIMLARNTSEGSLITSQLARSVQSSVTLHEFDNPFTEQTTICVFAGSMPTS